MVFFPTSVRISGICLEYNASNDGAETMYSSSQLPSSNDVPSAVLWAVTSLTPLHDVIRDIRKKRPTSCFMVGCFALTSIYTQEGAGYKICGFSVMSCRRNFVRDASAPSLKVKYKFPATPFYGKTPVIVKSANVIWRKNYPLNKRFQSCIVPQRLQHLFVIS